MNRNLIFDYLHRGVCEIVFEKVDGSTRNMVCTLNEHLIPKNDSESEKRSYTRSNDDVIAVWDMQNEGWRSFRISSLKVFNGLNVNVKEEVS